MSLSARLLSGLAARRLCLLQTAPCAGQRRAAPARPVALPARAVHSVAPASLARATWAVDRSGRVGRLARSSRLFATESSADGRDDGAAEEGEQEEGDFDEDGLYQGSDSESDLLAEERERMLAGDKDDDHHGWDDDEDVFDTDRSGEVPISPDETEAWINTAPEQPFPKQLTRDMMDALSGVPRGKESVEQLLKLLSDGRVSGDAERAVELFYSENAKKYEVEEDFRDFVKLVYGYEGPDKEVLILCALSLHAQLCGPTVEGDMFAVSETMPLVQKLAFEKLEPEEALEEIRGMNEKDKDDVLTSILDKLQSDAEEPRKLRLEDLRYWKLYPKKVREWVESVKTPVGKYDDGGFWVPAVRSKLVEKAIEVKQNRAREQYERLMLRELGIQPGAVPIIPEDLKGHYRFGLTSEEVEELNPSDKLRRVLSFAHATNDEINQFRIAQAIKRWERFPGDTGSDEVQVAVMSVRIEYMNRHFKHHHKDHSRKRHFLKMVVRRQKILNRLKSTRTDVYYALLADLGIPDVGRTFRVGFVGGITTPKKCRLSKHKIRRLNKEKTISQVAMRQRQMQML